MNIDKSGEKYVPDDVVYFPLLEEKNSILNKKRNLSGAHMAFF